MFVSSVLQLHAPLLPPLLHWCSPHACNSLAQPRRAVGCRITIRPSSVARNSRLQRGLGRSGASHIRWIMRGYPNMPMHSVGTVYISSDQWSPTGRPRTRHVPRGAGGLAGVRGSPGCVWELHVRRTCPIKEPPLSDLIHSWTNPNYALQHGHRENAK